MVLGLSNMTARNFTLFQPLGSFNLNDLDGYNDFKKNIAGQVQGEIALFQESWPVEIAALAFVVAYELSDEALVRLASGRIVRLFKHSDESVAYPEKVDSSLSQELEQFITNSSFVSEPPSPQPILQIDLAALWKKTDPGETVKRTPVFAELLSSAFKPAEAINLSGELPILPLLSAIILARPHGQNINYQPTPQASQLKLF
jgi:hypothetical protein